MSLTAFRRHAPLYKRVTGLAVGDVFTTGTADYPAYHEVLGIDVRRGNYHVHECPLTRFGETTVWFKGAVVVPSAGISGRSQTNYRVVGRIESLTKDPGDATKDSQ